MVRTVREIMAAEKKASGEIPMMGIRPGPPSLPPVVDMTFFYRMTGDWKRYDLFPLKRDPIFGSSPYMGNLKAKIEPYRFYDYEGARVRNADGSTGLKYFAPTGEKRSLLKTNAESPGCLLMYPSRRFVFSATVLRVSPDYRGVMEELLWSGVYRFSFGKSEVVMPLSSFVPLNPLDPEPMVFVAVHRQFIIAENQVVQAYIEFPKGESFGGYGIGLELPGILVNPVVYYGPDQKEPEGPQGSMGFQGPQGSNDPNRF